MYHHFTFTKTGDVAIQSFADSEEEHRTLLRAASVSVLAWTWILIPFSMTSLSKNDPFSRKIDRYKGSWRDDQVCLLGALYLEFRMKFTLKKFSRNSNGKYSLQWNQNYFIQGRLYRKFEADCAFITVSPRMKAVSCTWRWKMGPSSNLLWRKFGQPPDTSQ